MKRTVPKPATVIENNYGKITIALILLLLLVTSFGIFEYTTSNKETLALNQRLQNTHDLLQENISTLERTRKEKEGLESILSEEQKAKLALQEKTEKDAKKIDKLQKLTTIDPELLKKYSKIYFLSENYSPPDLSSIDSDFWIKPDKEIEVLEDIKPFLNNLLEEAKDDDLELRVLSGYRSFDEQTSLKVTYTTLYGTGANQFSADQGYSEHQMGTTVDFTTPAIVGAEISFENTKEFEWLKDNAYKYGFILSYPKNNNYYVYEPWHWRFVGVALATDLEQDGEQFYERDQRSLDKYLIKIFDK
jgi:LAS superfamily LD-carboxypeptidase LdcB